MAYNPMYYNPYGYTQSIGQANQMFNQPVNALVSVTGIEGAKAYQLPPNSAVPLFDANEDILYVKTTDAAGYPTIKMFRFEPMEQQGEQSKADYVSRSEFDELAEKVNNMAKPKGRKVSDNAE